MESRPDTRHDPLEIRVKNNKKKQRIMIIMPVKEGENIEKASRNSNVNTSVRVF